MVDNKGCLANVFFNGVEAYYELNPVSFFFVLSILLDNT